MDLLCDVDPRGARPLSQGVAARTPVMPWKRGWKGQVGGSGSIFVLKEDLSWCLGEHGAGYRCLTRALTKPEGWGCG